LDGIHEHTKKNVSSFNIDYGPLKLNRIKLWHPTLAEKRNLIGTYYSDELETHYKIKLHNDQLIAVNQRHPIVRLRPLEANYFTGDKWFATIFKFSTHNAWQTTNLYISNRRSKNNKFKRVVEVE